jgi:hypothetical protein
LNLREFSGAVTPLQYENLFKSIEGLEYLNLAYTNANDLIVARMKTLVKLKQLDLWGCSNITDTSLKHLSNNNPLLNHLSCRLTSISDYGLQFLSRMKQMIELDISCTKDISPSEFKNLLEQCNQLSSLHVFACQWINQECFHHIQALACLKQLDISYCKISKDSIQQFSQSKPHISIIYAHHWM